MYCPFCGSAAVDEIEPNYQKWKCQVCKINFKFALHSAQEPTILFKDIHEIAIIKQEDPITIPISIPTIAKLLSEVSIELQQILGQEQKNDRI
jgi:hypothetical protein